MMITTNLTYNGLHLNHSFRYFSNSDIPQGSVLSPSLFLLFISDVLSSTHFLFLCYVNDSTLHNST